MDKNLNPSGGEKFSKRRQRLLSVTEWKRGKGDMLGQPGKSYTFGGGKKACIYGEATDN